MSLPIVDLSSRITDQESVYRSRVKDPNSALLLKNGQTETINTLLITLGATVSAAGDLAELEDDVLTLQRKQFALVASKERLAVPYNMFGRVTGWGTRIRQGIVVSPGKIDPGFSGPLKIGLFNAGNGVRKIKVGDGICVAYFSDTEATAATPQTLLVEPLLEPLPQSLLHRWQRAIAHNPLVFLALLSLPISVASVVVVALH